MMMMMTTDGQLMDDLHDGEWRLMAKLFLARPKIFFQASLPPGNAREIHPIWSLTSKPLEFFSWKLNINLKNDLSDNRSSLGPSKYSPISSEFSFSFCGGGKSRKIIQNKVVVSNISYFHPYLGRWSNLSISYFWNGLKLNHQLEIKVALYQSDDFFVDFEVLSGVSSASLIGSGDGEWLLNPLLSKIKSESLFDS